MLINQQINDVGSNYPIFTWSDKYPIAATPSSGKDFNDNDVKKPDNYEPKNPRPGVEFPDGSRDVAILKEHRPVTGKFIGQRLHINNN